MSRYSDTVRDDRIPGVAGTPIPGVLVYVYDWGYPPTTTGRLSDLTDDDLTTALPNPLTTDEFGQYYFNASIGVKLIEYWFGGKLLFREQIILTPTGSYPGNDAALRTDLATSEGAALVGADDGASGAVFTTVGGFIAKLLSSAGSSVISFLQAGAGAVARSLQSKLRETVSVTDFGADPTGVADSLAAFNLAFATGSRVMIPEGSFALSGLPTAPTGTFSLQGAGKGKSLLIINHAAASGALAFSPASTSNHVEIKGFTLVANHTAPCQLGIVVTFPAATNYVRRQADIDVDFKSDLSATTPYPHTWGRGIRITNAWFPRIKVSGGSAPIVGDTGNTGCLEITGGSYGSIAAELDATWFYGADGVRCSAYTESLKLSPTSEFVGVVRGVYVPSTTTPGGVAGTYRSAYLWLDGHIASQSVGVDLDGVYDLVSYLNMQRWGDPSATNWTGYKLNNVTSWQLYNVISGAEASGGITTKGMVVTGAGSVNGYANVRFENCDQYFSLDASTSRCTIIGRTVDVGGNNYSIAGTLHDIQWTDANGNLLRYAGSQTLQGAVYSAVGELGKTSDAAVTYTGAEFLNDAIFRSGTGAISDTTPTAAQICAAMPGCVPGTGKRITINNARTGTLTLLAGTGVTLVGTTTVTNGNSRDYLIRVTNSAGGSEAVRLIGLQSGAI